MRPLLAHVEVVQVRLAQGGSQAAFQVETSADRGAAALAELSEASAALLARVA